MNAEFSVRVHSRLAELPAKLWDTFGSPDAPLSHEFLSALEEAGCLGEAVGWIPRHLSFAATGSASPFAAMPADRKSVV